MLGLSLMLCKMLQIVLQAARPVVKSPTVVEKPCSKCHVLKPAAEFFRREQSHDGLQSWCRACKNAARQAQEPRGLAIANGQQLPPTALPPAPSHPMPGAALAPLHFHLPLR